MKQKISAPVAVVAIVAVVGVLGLFLYNRHVAAAGPPPESAPRGLTARPMKPFQIPRTKEEGMALYRQMSGGRH